MPRLAWFGRWKEETQQFTLPRSRPRPRPSPDGAPRSDTTAAAAHMLGVLWASASRGAMVKELHAAIGLGVVCTDP